MPVGFTNPFVGLHVGLGESPESFHAVDVDVPLDVLLVSVIDGAVDVAQRHQSLIPGGGVREDLPAFPDSFPDDRFQNFLLGVRDEFEVHLPVTLEHSKDGLFPNFRSSPSFGQSLEAERPPCLFPEILEGSSIIALIHLHGAGELPAVVQTLLDQRVSDGSVCAIDGSVVWTMEDALETTSGEAHGKPIDELVPEPERKSFPFQKCSGLESELRPAVTTPIGGIMSLVDPVRLAVFTACDSAKSRSQK